VDSPDSSRKLFGLKTCFFVRAKKRPSEALFVRYKNGLKGKKLVANSWNSF